MGHDELGRWGHNVDDSDTTGMMGMRGCDRDATGTRQGCDGDDRMAMRGGRGNACVFYFTSFE
jgi:hypothetical protein